MRVANTSIIPNGKWQHRSHNCIANGEALSLSYKRLLCVKPAQEDNSRTEYNFNNVVILSWRREAMWQYGSVTGNVAMWQCNNVKMWQCSKPPIAPLFTRNVVWETCLLYSYTLRWLSSLLCGSLYIGRSEWGRGAAGLLVASSGNSCTERHHIPPSPPTHKMLVCTFSMSVTVQYVVLGLDMCRVHQACTLPVVSLFVWVWTDVNTHKVHLRSTCCDTSELHITFHVLIFHCIMW